MYNIDKIKYDVKENLSKFRYEHSIMVANEAKKLAIKYNYDENKAYIAGLLHDIAKEFSDDENKKWIKKCNLNEKLLDKRYKDIIHADIGACFVKSKYNLDDEICNAIKYHTIGHVPMDTLDKIIFIADKIARKNITSIIKEEKKLAYKDLDRTLVLIIENEKKYLESIGKSINGETLKLLNFLKSKNS